MSAMLEEMPITAGLGGADADATSRLAQSTYRHLRAGGLSDTDIMAFAGEILALVAAGVRDTPDPEFTA